MRLSFRKKILPGVYVGFSKSMFKNMFKVSRRKKQDNVDSSKVNFIEKNFVDFTDMLVDYYAANGEFVPSAEAYNHHTTKEIEDLRAKFSNVIDVMNEGGNLTDKRIETAITCKNQLKGIIDAIEDKNPLFDKVTTLRELEVKSSKYKKYIIIACVTLYGIPFGIYFYVKRRQILADIKTIQDEILKR